MQDLIAPTNVAGDPAGHRERGMRWLSATARPLRTWIVAGAACALLASATTLAAPWLFAPLVDRLIHGARPDEWRPAAIAIGVLATSSLVLGAARTLVWKQFRLRYLARIQADLLRRISRAPLASLREAGSGYLTSRIEKDLEATTVLFPDAVVGALVQLLVALGALAALFALHPPSAWICVAFLPVLGLHFLAFRGPLRRASARRLELWARWGSALQEHLRSLESQRLFRVERVELARTLTHLRALAGASWRQSRVDVSSSLASEAVGTLWPLVFLFVVASWVAGGDVSFGAWTAIFFYAGAVFANARGVAGAWLARQSARPALERLASLRALERPRAPARTVTPPRPDTPVVSDARLEVRDLRFRYADGPWVLDGVDLRLERGRIYGLCGASGAGKSTLARLLLRIESPHAGEIRIDGRPLETMPSREIPEHVALVPQELLLARRTIAENVAWGRRAASDDEIRAAARAAGVDRFLGSLPNGIDTPVGEDGARLSRGERQRIALARALLLEPALLVLDEASASLDPESEECFLRAIEELAARGTTCLLVSHSPRVLACAERCFRLESGRVRALPPSAIVGAPERNEELPRTAPRAATSRRRNHV